CFARIFCAAPTSNFSKIVGDRAVETAALAELRRANADAAAVAQLVDLIEQVDDIEPDFDDPDFWNCEDTLKRGVDSFIWMTFFRVGETSAQAVPVEKINSRFPVAPSVRETGRRSHALVVIEEDPVLANVSQLVGVEQVLRGNNLGGTRPFVS